jgi:hypothetical protein
VTIDTNVGNYAPSSVDTGTITSIIVDSSDRPRVAYYDAVNADLKYAYCNSGCDSSSSWSKITLASTATSGRYAELKAYPPGGERIAFARYDTFYSTDPAGSAGGTALDYLECSSNCTSSGSWTLRGNLNGAYASCDPYGVCSTSYNTSYNNPMIFDLNNRVRLNMVLTDGNYSLYHKTCSTNCASTGTWGSTKLTTAYWSDIGLDYFGNLYTVYYNNGLYFRWDMIP